MRYEVVCPGHGLSVQVGLQLGNQAFDDSIFHDFFILLFFFSSSFQKSNKNVVDKGLDKIVERAVGLYVCILASGNESSSVMNCKVLVI